MATLSPPLASMRQSYRNTSRTRVKKTQGKRSLYSPKAPTVRSWVLYPRIVVFRLADRAPELEVGNVIQSLTTALVICARVMAIVRIIAVE